MSSSASGVLLIVGASARSAAQSALRAGFFPCGVDLFADADLLARCPAHRVRSLGLSLVDASAQFPPGPWLYAGGLENRPALVEALSRSRVLLGNAPKVLRAVRDPIRVQHALQAAGFPATDVRPAPKDLPTDGSWLVKRRDGSGGAHVARWQPPRSLGAGDVSPRLNFKRSQYSPKHYWQRFVAGTPHAGLYVAAGGRAQLLCVTRQLLASPGGDGEAFAYSGSIGPCPLTPAEQRAWQQIGDCLAAAFPQVGLFGVDAIVNDQGVWPVEVNPRYPASAEIWDLATGRSAIGVHVDACANGVLPSELPISPQVFGKQIVVAQERLHITRQWSAALVAETLESDQPRWADIPRPRTVVQAGQPLLTTLAQGQGEAEVEARLREQAAEILATLKVTRRTARATH